MGVEVPATARAPQWPSGAGPKVFGYLQSFPGLQALLEALQAQPIRLLIFGRGIPAALRARFAGRQISFTDELVDLSAVSKEADWVLHHGNHGTSAIFLQAGVAQLLIPRHQEHLFGALRLVEQKAALLVFQDQNDYRGAVSAMRERQDIREGAKAVRSACPVCSTDTNVEYLKHLFTQIA
jgi:UDP:flavonoid glycosyltransferase YjiC (YdhE family)